MTRRQQILALLPATLPDLRRATGLSGGNLSRVLADAEKDEALHRTGGRRKYVYHAGPASPVQTTVGLHLQRIW